MKHPILPIFFLLTVSLAGAQDVIPAGPVSTATPTDADAPSFQLAIKPLLQEKCIRCHDEQTHQAELDLSTLRGLGKGGESGPVLVAGDPEKSLLFEKIQGGAMPPGKKDRLDETQVDAVRRWIAAGARIGSSDREAMSGSSPTQDDIVPILLRHCTSCHGLRQKQGGLDLSTRASMLMGGESGPAIVPGKPVESLLIQRIRLGQMPPPTQLVEGSVKPVDASEAETLATWIALGAPEVGIEADIASTTPDPLVGAKDRDFWAFKPPGRVPVPRVAGMARVRNPIDAFVLEKLEHRGLSLAPEAGRLVLLRRASFDLTGLPPEPDEVREFLEDDRPDAYDRSIDRFLASPRYGERWGRYWLDLAGYADSEGKREQDLPRPHAWRYRDYVIKSFNNDKPYNRFLREQIAGDELADYEQAAEIPEELADNLIATGFLRMAPDGTWANITGYAADRIDVIADEIDILGSSVMGLSMKCARCHHHKFDPIPQRDYYRLAAIFKGAYDEYDWLKPDVRPGLGPISQDVQTGRLLPFVTTAERRAWEADPRRREPPMIQALWDRGVPSPTYIYRRGDLNSPGRLVGPGVPSVLTDGKTPFEVKPPWPGAKQTGRRLAFANWLTQPAHPLTARVVVNRIWKHHFGTGIVKTLGNFGKAGASPTHPELLDWLAGEFVDRGWSWKAIHRLIMTSSTYRQVSDVSDERDRVDPDHTLVSRMPMTRLDAEALYDTLLLVAGRLVEKRYGPSDPVDVRGDGLVTPTGTAEGWRRMIYVRQARKQIPTHLENFDYPQMNPNCIERRDSIVALQALQLMNAGMVQDLSAGFARRVSSQAEKDRSRQIDRVYLIALSRMPVEEERRIGLESLQILTEQWSKTLAESGKPDQALAEEKALATYCHSIMNSASFLYID